MQMQMLCQTVKIKLYKIIVFVTLYDCEVLYVTFTKLIVNIWR